MAASLASIAPVDGLKNRAGLNMATAGWPERHRLQLYPCRGQDRRHGRPVDGHVQLPIRGGASWPGHQLVMHAAKVCLTDRRQGQVRGVARANCANLAHPLLRQRFPDYYLTGLRTAVTGGGANKVPVYYDGAD
jgi:hypothetical protein